MAALRFVVPGNPASRTGGYIYDARICRGLSALGWRVTVCRLGEGFPFPDQQTLAAARRQLATPPGKTQALTVIDGLALAALPADLLRQLQPIALVHHPLAAETGLSAAAARQLRDRERAALALTRRVIVTSPATADVLSNDYGVDRRRLGVVLPGTDPAQLAPNPRPNGVAELLYVASVTPRKGHALLLRALLPLRTLPWRLRLIGSLYRDPACAWRVRRLSRLLGLNRRVEFCGELDAAALRRAYRRATLFVSASYYEGYGMALAEALARGLPVVAGAGGAVADTVPDAAGVLVPPGDRAALTQALRRLLSQPQRRLRLRHGARAARAALPTWEHTSRRFAAELALAD